MKGGVMMSRKIKSHKGFTIVEMLMALMIFAMLLTSMAVAFNASATNYNQNEAMIRLMNTARQSLYRITTDLRTAKAVALIGAGAGEDADNRLCSMMTVDDKNITYHYNKSGETSYDNTLNDNTLYLKVNAGASAGNYILCEDITDMTFVRSTVPDDPARIRNVQIMLTVADARTGNTQTVATAAVIRKNLE